MEPESSLPHSQVPTNCPSPELSSLTFKKGKHCFSETSIFTYKASLCQNPDENSLKHLSYFDFTFFRQWISKVLFKCLPFSSLRN